MKRSSEIPLLAAILALAAFFRFFRLDAIPPGFQFDQAFNAFDLLRLLQGQFAIFFPANTGREPLYFYLSMPSAALFGTTAFAVKLTSAVIGLLTVPLIYWFTRTLFTSSSLQRGRNEEGDQTRIALLAAFFSAISFWHIFFSRDGLRVILEVPLTLLTFWYLWRACTPTPSLPLKGEGAREGVWMRVGLFLALALYTYPSARLLPLAIIFLVALAAWNDRSRARDYFKGVLISFAVAAFLVAPLAIYFALHPDQFFAHTESISVFDPRVSGGDIPAAIWKNLVAILGMFFIQGDNGSIHNLPYRPIFDPLLGAIFLVGAAVMLAALFITSPFQGDYSPRSGAERGGQGEGGETRVNRSRSVLLFTWIIISLASSLFSDDAPNFLRMLPALPAIMILPAWGASKIWDRLKGSFARPVWVGTLGLILAISTGLTYRDYFVSFANLSALYYTFDADKVDVANWINANSETKQIFLAPLWYQQGTISLMTHIAPLKSFESRDTIVLPSRASGKDAIYGFPPEQDRKIETLASRLGTLGARDDLIGSNGDKILLAYRVPFANLPDPQNPFDTLSRGSSFIQPQKLERANWNNQIELLGHTLDLGTGGRNPTIILFLRSLAQISADYTFSIKVFDDKNRVWGQEDKWTGDNSYETSHWGIGDLVIEKFYPGMNPCMPAGDYRLTVEAYNPMTSEVLALVGSEGNAVSVGTMRANASQGNRLEDLEPEQAKEVRISDNLQLIGYTLTPDQPRVGDTFSLSLFWRGSGKGSAEKVAIRLGDAKLAETTIQIPEEGRGICTFSDFTVPESLETGAASIWVNDKQITSVQVVK